MKKAPQAVPLKTMLLETFSARDRAHHEHGHG